MIEERDGWFVKNVKDATWLQHEAFGKVCRFDIENPFPQVGVHIFLLEPGKPNCRYHREEAQEDFLVLAGRCRLLINGEERLLGQWDFFHCPPGVEHVFVGAGDGPCVVLMVGARSEDEQLLYPVSELAGRYGASAEVETPDPGVAYAAFERPTPGRPLYWDQLPWA